MLINLSVFSEKKKILLLCFLLLINECMYTENCEEIRYAAKIRCKKAPRNVGRDISYISKLSFNKTTFSSVQLSVPTLSFKYDATDVFIP